MVDRCGVGRTDAEPAGQVGSTLGIAGLGTVLFASLGGILSNRLDDQPGLDPGGQEPIVDAVKGAPGRPSPVRRRSPGPPRAAEDARVAFTDATRYAALVTVGFLVIGLVAGTRLPAGQPSGR
ncbi:hypothetical protein V6U90_13370 [Micromonospora sp. CPCC 206060]|uniref:hypothetical protein n=1 Tax=Micromonospora sp. CPCC 206060 TaxID=3122406 RepID=UPI002FEF4473